MVRHAQKAWEQKMNNRIQKTDNPVLNAMARAGNARLEIQYLELELQRARVEIEDAENELRDLAKLERSTE